MKVKIDSFLRAEDLGGATSKTPVEGEIVFARLIPAAELAFASDVDRLELKVLVHKEEFDWLANKTSLRSFVTAFGDDSDAWIGKKIKLYSVEQSVAGKIKQVVYATA